MGQGLGHAGRFAEAGHYQQAEMAFIGPSLTLCLISLIVILNLFQDNKRAVVCYPETSSG
jgi:hypothetical protein